MSQLITAHIKSPSRADRVLHDPFLLSRIMSHATISTLGRCLRVSSEFFIAAGPALYRDLEISADVLAGPMTDGLSVESLPGYRHIRPRRRNTMRPLLEQIRRLKLVFTHEISLKPDLLAPALIQVEDVYLYFGRTDRTLLRDPTPYYAQPMFEVMRCAPDASSFTCSFLPEVLCGLSALFVDDGLWTSRLLAIPLTLVLGTRFDVGTTPLPDFFPLFDTLRIVYAQRSIDGDINNGQPLRCSPTESFALSSVGTDHSAQAHSLSEWWKDLAEFAGTRRGKRTEVYLLDDLGLLSETNDVGSGDVGPVIRQEAADWSANDSPWTDAEWSMFRLKSRREFLAEVRGVLEPEVMELYQRMEDTPPSEKMDRKRDGPLRFVAYMFGDWTLVPHSWSVELSDLHQRKLTAECRLQRSRLGSRDIKGGLAMAVVYVDLR